MQVVFEQILIVLLTTAAGFYCGKAGIISPAVKKGLSNLVLSISVPASIIASGNLVIQGSAWFRVLYVLLISAAYHLVLFYGMKLVALRHFKNKDKGKISTLAVTFGNVMFVGFPVINGIYGADGLFLAAIFTVCFNLLFYTAGMSLVDPAPSFSLKKVLLTPFNISLVIMFVLLATQYKLPAPLQTTFSMLGGTCTPLSLLVIGAMIAQADIRPVFRDPMLYILSLVRLLVIPFAVLLIVAWLPLDVTLRRTVVALAAMPGAAMTAMVGESFQCEADFASFTVVQSTILFALTFPFVIYISHLVIV